MSFEQSEQQEQQQKKKKSLDIQKKDQFFLEQKIRNESSSLLQKLAGDIAAEFGINISQAKQLLEGTIKDSLGELTSGVSSTLNTLQQQKLGEAIIKAKEALKIASKEVRENLKKSLEHEKILETDPGKTIKKIFSKKFIQRGVQPASLTDECIGGILGLLDSAEAIILFLYGLGKGVLVTPYHLYLLATGKASYDGWEKV